MSSLVAGFFLESQFVAGSTTVRVPELVGGDFFVANQWIFTQMSIFRFFPSGYVILRAQHLEVPSMGFLIDPGFGGYARRKSGQNGAQSEKSELAYYEVEQNQLKSSAKIGDRRL